MTTQKLTVREPMALTPAEVVENATTQAKLLMDIVEKTGCFQLIAKKKYLQVEAWETIGAFNKTHAVTESIIPLIREGEVIGYQATVQLYEGGRVVGGAIMPCFFTENCCKGKEGDAKHKAAISAAQTFATSKAYRMNFSYIAILAGYEPTPSEEMTGEDTLGGVKSDEKQEHYCLAHKTFFFKKGRMESYAHPIKGTDKWCYEHKSKSKSSPPKEESNNKPPAEPEAEPEEVGTVAGINKEWLTESLKELQGKGLESYSEANLLSYMKTTYKVEGKDVMDAISNLNEGQAKHFVKKLQEALVIESPAK